MIDVLIAFDNNLQELADLNMPILQKYCHKHNHGLIIRKIENFDKPAAWFKPIAIYEELNKNQCDYLLWLDIDTLVLNLDFSLDNLSSSNKSLYISNDINGINSGVMLIKNCDQMKIFFSTVSSLYEQFKNHGWWEQAAIMELIKHNYLNINHYTEYVPQKILNAYVKGLVATTDDGYVDENSFVLHLPSVNKQLRIKTISDYIDKYHTS
jgi:hypothetical protein